MINLDREKLVKSPHLVMRPYRDGFMVHHSLYGFPTVLNEPSVEVLSIFERPVSIAEVRSRYDIEDLEKWLCYFLERHFLVAERQDERVEIRKEVEAGIKRITEGQHLESLGLILDEACNFDCSYCLSRKVIEASARGETSPHRMSWSVARDAIDRFAEFIKHKTKMEVYFGGSEPLLDWGVMERTILYCQQNYGSRFDLSFSTNTNASLISPRRADFLRRHKVTITTSLDGLEVVNDKIRRMLNGQGTFDKIIKGWDNLASVGQEVEWFCLTLTDENIEEIGEDFFDFIASRGIKSCSFEPDIILSMRHSPEAVINALLRFKRMGEERDITVGGMWDKPLKNMFEPRLRERIFNCSAFTGKGISVLPSGDILSCSYSATKIGRINNLPEVLRSEQFRTLIVSRAVGNIAVCQGCPIEGQCIGGCYITSEYGQLTEDLGCFHYRCELYRKVTYALLDSAADADSL